MSNYIDNIVKNAVTYDLVSKPLADDMANEFSIQNTYAVGDYVMHDYKLYKCISAVTTAGNWNSAKWQECKIGDEINGGVKFTTQTLTSEQKAQARNNIGAVSQEEATPDAIRYSAQSLTDAQKNQARVNVGTVASTSIAEEFSTSKAYAVGDMVMYNSKLYKFKTAHSAGAWNNAQVDAVSVKEEISSLSSDLSNIYLANDFNKLSPEYYTYDGYTLTVIKNDTRSEATIPINQRYHLESGKKYVFSADYAIGVNLFLYNPDTSAFLFRINAIGISVEETFIPENSGDYVFKANIGINERHYIENPIILEYDVWEQLKGIGITVKTFDNIADDVNINRAIRFANIHKFSRVIIPQKKTGDYLITSPIMLRSNVVLDVAEGVNLVLDNSVNAPIVQNANFTPSSTDTVKDVNIVVRGGVWNGNGANQEKWVDIEGIRTLTVLFKFSGVENLTIENCTLQNSQTYGFLGCNVDGCVIDSCTVDVGDMQNLNNGDGIHFLGCCKKITVKNCTIHSEDNCIAFNADDAPHGYACFDGPIDEVYLYNNYIDNYDNGQGLLFLSALNKLSNLVVDGLYGKGGYCLKVDNFDLKENGNGNYQNISIKNVNFEVLNNSDYGIRLRGNADYIELKNIRVVYKTPQTSTAGFTFLDIRTGSKATETIINNLIISDLDIVHNWNDRELSGILLSGNSIIRTMRIDGYRIINPTGTVMPIFMGSADVNQLYASKWITHNIPYGYIRTTSSGHRIARMLLNNLTTDIYSKSSFMFATPPLELKITGITTNVYVPYTITDIYFDNTVMQNNYIFSSSYGGYFRLGQIITRVNGDAYLCTQSGSPLTTQWEPNTEYSKGSYVRLNDYVIICIKGGTSGDSLTLGYSDFDDGTCRWRKLYNGTCTFVKLTTR